MIVAHSLLYEPVQTRPTSQLVPSVNHKTAGVTELKLLFPALFIF